MVLYFYTTKQQAKPQDVEVGLPSNMVAHYVAEQQAALLRDAHKNTKCQTGGLVIAIAAIVSLFFFMMKYT